MKNQEIAELPKELGRMLVALVGYFDEHEWLAIAARQIVEIMNLRFDKSYKKEELQPTMEQAVRLGFLEAHESTYALTDKGSAIGRRMIVLAERQPDPYQKFVRRSYSPASQLGDLTASA